MSIFLKPGVLKVRDENEDFSPINIMAEESSQNYLAAIQNKGEEVMDAIEEKGEDTIDSIPSDYTALTNEVEGLKEDLNLMSTATSSDVGKALKAKTVTNGKVTEWEFGDTTVVDPSLTQSGQAADAKITGDKINEVYTGHPTIVFTINRLNIEEVETGKQLKSDGTLEDNSNYATSGYVEVDPEKTYLAFTGQSSLTNPRICMNWYRCCFYNESKEFVRQGTKNSDRTVTVPANVKYARISVSPPTPFTNNLPMVEFVDSVEDISPVYVEYNKGEGYSHGINYLDETQQDILERLADVEASAGDIISIESNIETVKMDLYGERKEVYSATGENFKQKYYINSSGVEVSSNSWNIFTHAINNEDSVIYSHLTSSYSGNPKWVFLDDNDGVIEAVSPVNSTDDTLLPIPEGAVMIRASVSNTDAGNTKIALYTENQFLSKSETLSEISSEVNPIKEKIGYFVTPLIHGAYIKIYTNSNIVPYADLDNPIANDNWYYQKIACSEGDYFVVSGSGGDAARLWGFYDAAGKCLITADRMASASNLMLCAPMSAAWLVVNSTVNASVTSANVFDAIKDKPKVEFVNDVGISWEWWINGHYTDQCGNLYVGFIDKEKFCGVLCRKADGTVVYKRKLFQSYTADDHSACSVNMLSDGRLVIMATQGHTGNYRHFALAQKPYTIDCDFSTNIININPPEGHRYSFSYSQEFIDENDVIYNFFRISGYTIGSPDVNDGRGWGYIKSDDYGQTWKLYRFLSKDTEYQTDPYLSVKDVDGEDTLKRILVQGTSELLGGNVIYAGFVDLADGSIYDNTMTLVGSSSEVPNVVTIDTTASATNYVFDGTSIFMASQGLTPVVITPTTSGQRRRIRILNVAKTGQNLLTFVYGKSKDEAYTFEYRLYYNGNDIALTDVGLNYYKSYIPGADLSYDGKTVFCSVNVSHIRDGRHAIHRIVTDGTQVVEDTIINVSNRLLAKPMLSDNGILSLLSGKYNEPDDSSTNYDKWVFMPVFLNVSIE